MVQTSSKYFPSGPNLRLLLPLPPWIITNGDSYRIVLILRTLNGTERLGTNLNGWQVKSAIMYLEMAPLSSQASARW
jgi:hypothetical protein